MANTYTDNGGGAPNGSDLNFTYSFPTIETTDSSAKTNSEVQVALNGVLQDTTKYDVESTPAGITFKAVSVDSSLQAADGAPKSGVIVRVFRATDVDPVDDVRYTFQAGASIRAQDLNKIYEHGLYALEEHQEQPIQTKDLQNDAVTSDKLDTNIDIAGTLDVTGATTLDSTLSVAGTTTAAAINASGAVGVDGDFDVNTDKFTVAASSGNTTVAGNIVVSGTVDGRDIAADGAKLDAIETSSTADQTNSEIRALVESATDSNVFTDADHSKLDAIEASATADQTAAEIRTLVEAATDSNVFTDADHTKLNAIEASATADQTGAEIKSAYEAESDTNAFTDAEKSKVADAVLNADLDGKGEILIGDGSGDPTALAVGTNTHVLTADSTEPTGVKWAAQTGSGGGGSDITVVDESTTLSTAATKFTFTGAGVTATEPSTDEITVTIPIPEGTAILSTGESGGTKFLREDGDGTSSWQTVSTTDATKMPLAGGTFVGDVVFDNATHAGFDMTWDESDKALEFADDTKAVFGGDNGLSIYHSTADGSNNRTYIENTKNDLVLKTTGTDADDVGVESRHDFWVSTNFDSGSPTMSLLCNNNAEVSLYYAGAKKFDTTSTGVDITGNIVVSGTVDGIDIATDVAANTAKVTNATHTGEVTGGTALTIADDIVDEANLKVDNSPTNDYVLTAKSSASGGLTWAAASSGTITALNNQTANRLTTISSTTTELDGEANLTFDGSTLIVTGNQTVSKQISAVGFEAPAEIAADWSIAAANNAMYPGPMTVAAGVTVTVPASRTLTIV